MKEFAECPICGARRLVLRYEVSYVYSYLLDDDAPGRANEECFHPYAYDDRRQKAAEQYVECADCHAKFPCYLQRPDFTLRQLRESLCARRGDGINSEV